MKPVYALCYYLLKLYFTLFHRLEVKGKRDLPEGPAIIAPNHTSFFDPPIVGVSLTEELHYLAKSSLFRFPIFSWLIRQLNAHPVSGKTEDLKSIKAALNLLSEGKKIIIFPEGERSFDGKLLEIKEGIALLSLRSDAPLIPVQIEGAISAWPRGKKIPRLFKKITVTYLDPIYPKDFAHLPPKEARTKIKETLCLALKRDRY